MTQVEALQDRIREVKKQVQEKIKQMENPRGDPAIRQLRRRLRRLQRKRRGILARSQPPAVEKVAKEKKGAEPQAEEEPAEEAKE